MHHSIYHSFAGFYFNRTYFSFKNRYIYLQKKSMYDNIRKYLKYKFGFITDNIDGIISHNYQS